MPGTMVDVQPVVNRRDWRSLLALPGRLHGTDPHWIEPLHHERRALWSPRHPWFGHARGRLWLARVDGRVAGAISAQVDDLHERVWHDRVGYFGQLEADNDPAVFSALLDTAADWLRTQRCTAMRGPFDLGINQQCGLLVDGFDTPPMLMMGHALPYYGPALEAAGLKPAMDLLAYLLHTDFEPPRAMRRVIADGSARIRFRPLNLRDYWGELERLRAVYNDAWSENWGFVPLTEAEFRHMGRALKPLLRADLVQIAEIDGEVAGFILALPNVNELIADLHGRLLPFGWARLLWRIKRGRARSARVPLMGVRRRHRGWPLGPAIALGLVDKLRRPLHDAGIDRLELSWILETNQAMRSVIEMLGARVYKRYRIYERPLAGA